MITLTNFFFNFFIAAKLQEAKPERLSTEKPRQIDHINRMITFMTLFKHSKRFLQKLNLILKKLFYYSQAKGGEARKAVDGKTSTVHEGDKCTETEAEKSPWWTVDLLDAYPVHFVRLTTRCCDGITVKKVR